MDAIVSLLYSGESLLPSGEYPEQWMPFSLQYATSLGDGFPG
jgi:hypothetical protein